MYSALIIALTVINLQP